MNIIIPIGGHGIRFKNEGFIEPKPLINVFEKTIIEYVLDNIYMYLDPDDKIFIIYNKKINESNKFTNLINTKYTNINLIELENDTKGAAETIFMGLKQIINNYKYNEKCMLFDCDTFYTIDLLKIFRNSINNMIFYRFNEEKPPIFSYIKIEENTNKVVEIKEKEKISNYANTGCYCFMDIQKLYIYCYNVLSSSLKWKNEPYTSFVINEMLNQHEIFIAYELNSLNIFSLGTPYELDQYIKNTYAFLLDLDGTLVITDEIYYEIWKQILEKYKITLTNELFKTYIQGNNDKYVLNSLLKGIKITESEISSIKDDLFIQNIDKLKVIDGVYIFLNQIYEKAYKCCIVTNCNRKVALEIIKHINIEDKINFVISANDCKNGKPNPEPYINAMNKYKISNNKCFVFEDSKTGILSGKSVNPLEIIGIETIYNSIELNKFGIYKTLKNYNNFYICNLFVKNTLNNLIDIKQYIFNSVNDLNIQDVIIEDNKLKGGFIADIVKLTLITNIKDYYCILKYENKNETGLSIMARHLDLYEREYYFYETISKYVPVKIPTFFSLVQNKNDDNIGIILENLFLKDNFKININLNTSTIDISLKIIDNMAKLHSQFWNKNLINNFPKLKKTNNKSFIFFNTFIKEKIILFENKWKDILTIEDFIISDNIVNNFKIIQNNLSLGNNLTFIHGDIKSPNIFYDILNNYEPYFIDWQHCGIGKGVQDLIFFIIESFDILNLDLLYPLFKNYYYKKIIEYGILNYSFEEFEKDIKDAICYVPFFTSVWFSSIPEDELIDKNFVYFFTMKLFYLLKKIKF